MGQRGDLDHRHRLGIGEIADEFAERPLHDGLVAADHAFQHDLGLRRHQQILARRLHHRQRPPAQPAGDRNLVGILRHLRAHGGGGVLQGDVGADADRDRQMLALGLGALEGEPQMAAEIEPDRGALGTEELQPVIARVIDAGLRVARDDDARGDEAPAVGWGVGEHRQHGAEIEAIAMDVLVRRRPLDHHGRQRRPDGAADEFADGAEVAAERGFAIGPVGEHVADHGNVVAGDVAEQDRGVLIVELLHNGGDFERRIGRPVIGAQASVLDHAPQRRTESRIQYVGIRHRVSC